MVQPVNYRSFFPQVSPGQSFLQGLQSGQAMRLAQEQAQAAAAKQAQLESAKQQALMTNAPEDFKLWAAADPAGAKTFTETIANMSKVQRDQEFNAGLPILNAIQSGEITTGMKLIRRRADALRNSGQEQAADDLDLLHKQIGDGQPEKALQTIRWLMNGIDPDRFSRMMETETKLQPNIEKANQNFVKLYGRQAYSMIQRGKPLDAIASLEAKINEGMQKGYNVDALQAMKSEAEARPDGSPDSIGLVLSAIDEKFGTDLKDIGEIQYKKEQTEDIRQRNESYRKFGDATAQADLEAKRAQISLSEANRDATEKKTALDAEFAPQEREAQIRRDQVAANAQEQTSRLEAQYTPVLKELEIEAARLQTDAAKRQAEIDAKYKEPMAALALQKERIAAQVAQRNNEIEEEYAAKVAQSKMSQEEANARIAQEKAANAQVLEQANAQIADANARIQAERAEVARPAEQAALALSQADAELRQAKAAVAKTVEQANAEIAQLDAAKKARENEIGAEFDRRKTEASTAQAEAERKKAEAQAEFAAQNEFISYQEKLRQHEQARKKENLEINQLAATLGLTQQNIVKAKVETNKLSADATKAWLEAESFGKGGIPKDQKPKYETDLRKEYESVSEGFRGIRDSYQQLQAVKRRGTGISDQAMINMFQRMIDPKGVVREPDVAALMQSSGAFAGVMQMLEKWKSGEKLSDMQRQQIIDAAGDIYKVAEKNNNLQKKSLEKFADKYGLDKEFIFPAETSQPANASTVKQPIGMPKGFKVIGKE